MSKLSVDACKERRKAERSYCKYKDNTDLHRLYKEKLVDANIIIGQERDLYYRNKLAVAAGNPKATYKIINSLLDKEFAAKKHPSCSSDAECANKHKDFFHSKVTNIYAEIKERADNLKGDDTMIHDMDPGIIPACTKDKFGFLPQSVITEVIKTMGSKSCELDPIPTWLFNNCIDDLLPIVTLIVNLSLQTGGFPDQLKSALVRPLLK